jgi:large subunit ribosomal protein L18
MSYKKTKKSRKKIKSTKTRLRLSVFRSNTNFSAQIIDDSIGNTVASVSSIKVNKKINIEIAKEMGVLIAKEASKKSIIDIVFDRGNYQYKGIVKAFADSARESGLNF